MKNKIASFCTLLLLIVPKSYSQTLEGETVISASYGFSAVKGVVKTLWVSDFIESSVNGIGAMGGGFDYGFYDKFSLGASYFTQSVSGKATADWFTFSDETKTETFDYSLRRTHISVNAKFHYVTDKDKLDLYSGVRMGYVIWDKKFESKDPGFPNNYDVQINQLKNRVSFGLIAFGARYYFTNSFGAGIELNVGPPYILNIGAVYRFGGSE